MKDLKITCIKLFYLIIVPLVAIYVTAVLFKYFIISWKGYLILTIGWLALLYGINLISKKDNKTHRFTWGFEFVPLLCIGFGAERGKLGIILPFCVFHFGWERK